MTTATELALEIRDQDNETVIIAGGTAQFAPLVHEDYWSYRVKLNDSGQAIVGFPKFGTIGIGFAQEEDWNTNFPYHIPAEETYDHIAHNKGDNTITRERCIEAIRLIQAQITPCGKPGRWIDKCVLPAGHPERGVHAEDGGAQR